MLGELYPFVVVAVFLATMAVLAYFSRGGATVFVGAVVLLMLGAAITFVPLFVRALPTHAQHVVTGIAFLIVAWVAVYEIYRKFRRVGGQKSKDDPN